MELKEIDVDKIKPNPMQPREHFDREKLKELADSIKEIGLINPIVVRKKGKQYEIVAGERRWKAHQIAKKKKILALEKKYNNEGEVAVESLIENVHREGLTIEEKGKFLKRIMEIEKIPTIHQLANRVKISKRAVYDAFELIGLDEDVRSVAATLPQSNIVEVTREIKDKKTQKQILKIAVKEDWGRKKIRETVKAIKKASPEVKEALLNDEIDVEQAERISKLKTPQARKKAIQEHKNIKMVDENIERNVEMQMSAKEKRELDKKLIQSKNWIKSFRNSVTDSKSQVEKTIKILLLATKFLPIMDDKQKEELNTQIDRFTEFLDRGVRLAEQIQDKL